MQLNLAHMKTHLQKLTQRWGELDANALFEIRCLKDDNPTQSKKYTMHQIEDALKFAQKLNEQKYNIYTTVNPIKAESNGLYARDDDIIGSFFCFCDCDDTESMQNVNKSFKEDFRGSFGVYTGEKPKRGHIYYELDTPLTDMDGWTYLQKGIAKKLKSDPVVSNPSRIMRLGGTINYPNKAKLERGRVTELSKFVKISGDIKTIEVLKKTFPYQSITQNYNLNFADFGYSDKLDVEQALINIRQGNHWHDNMIRVVASLVARNKSDAEIHDILTGITQVGYTIEQTMKEIEGAIQSARGKGFNINNKYSQTVVQDAVPIDTSIFKRWTPIDPLSIPQTDFLYGNKHYIRGYCSLTVSQGGIGKSSLVLTEAICMATNRELLRVPTKKCKVAYHNSEDPYSEIQKRVYAIAQFYEIKQEELHDLYISSGREHEILLMIGEYGVVNEQAMQSIEEFVKAEEIDLLIFDPLANLHTSTESVENFRTLGKTLSALADRCNIAIEVVHHTRKIQANQVNVSPEDARGGSSLIGAVRSARVLNRMSQADGEKLGIDNNVDYFKIEPAGKNNLSRPLDQTVWYKKSGQLLPNNDEVVVIEYYEPPSIFDGITNDKIRQLLTALGNCEVYLLANIRAVKNDYKMSVHEFIADFLDFDLNAPAIKRRISSMVKIWVEEDVLREETVDAYKVDPKAYRKGQVTKFITLGENRLT